MRLQISINIDAPAKAVWAVISDIENCANTITAIDEIEILEPAKSATLVGLKWKETRTMFGKSATEVMWITDAKKNAFYETRAESHGAVYVSRMQLESKGKATQLTMSFDGTAVTAGAKVLWALTGWMAKGAMKKALNQDLKDIKAAVENSTD